MSAPVHIEPYDPSWPDQFERERILLASILGEWLVGPIEHVGSTAVRGLAAKPVIDIMAGVGSLASSQPSIAVLEQHGYCYYPYKAEAMHWFCKHHRRYAPITCISSRSKANDGANPLPSVMHCDRIPKSPPHTNVSSAS